MRKAFLDELLAVAEQDERLMLLTGDLGFSVLEPFAERFPDRFLNVGVAEQNMLAVATGLAEAGFIPYVYSIATFASMRPYEFVRNGPLLHDLPVRIVGIGGGFDYGHNGITHYALEDLSIMRTQPRMTVVAPSDPQQARSALRAVHDLDGPAYLRISKGDVEIPGLEGRFSLGRLELLPSSEDDEIALIASGPIAREAYNAAGRLESRGVGATVAVCASLSPPPVRDLVELLSAVQVAVAVEDQYVNGGLGSLVCEVVAEHGLGTRVLRKGVWEMPTGLTGSQRYLHRAHGLSGDQIATAAREALERVHLGEPA
jgi:transketolase